MSPYLESNQEVVALFGYYQCNEIEREDVVLYNYSGSKNLLVKFIKAVPGDSWSLKGGDGVCEIVVNGSLLLNSEGQKYTIGNCKMLRLYADNYPIIPANTYLLLGDEVNGSLDSTQFGLIGGEDVVAKVVLSIW